MIATVLAVTAAIPDTPLDRDFCGRYWAGAAASCAAVKARVVANHSTTLPTLALGHPSKPSMFFIHGWPDNSAEWANLFGEFCEDYYCVAPSLVNFHPDLPMVTDRAQLGLGAQVEKLAATARELGLRNITLVAHDWGSCFGWIFAAKYPELISRVVQFDIGGMVETFMTPWIYSYQHQIMSAWDAQNDQPLAGFAGGVPNPSMLYWQAAWPYVAIWNDGNDLEAWKREAWPDTPAADWSGGWAFSPKPPPQPILFFWGDCNDPTCVGPKRTQFFFSDAWLPYLDEAAGDKAVEVHTNHWIYVYNNTGTLPSVVSSMREWLA